METFPFDGHSIRYARSGEGPPVVFLHNGGTSHAIWDAITPRLEGFEIFALDLLGFGESSKPERGYELPTYVDLLAAFVAAHGLPPVHLVGNCMGSAISLAFAARRPEAVRSMVLFNILTKATLARGVYGPMLGLTRVAPALVSGMSRIALGARLGKLGVRTQLGRLGVARRVHERVELAAPYADSSQSRALLGVLEGVPRYAWLDRFEPPPGFPPICTVWGLENRVLPPDAGRALVRTLRPTRQEWLEGCGHLPMLEAPERVAAIVRGFLAEAQGSRSDARGAA